EHRHHRHHHRLRRNIPMGDINPFGFNPLDYMAAIVKYKNDPKQLDAAVADGDPEAIAWKYTPATMASAPSAPRPKTIATLFAASPMPSITTASVVADEAAAAQVSIPDQLNVTKTTKLGGSAA